MGLKVQSSEISSSKKSFYSVGWVHVVIADELGVKCRTINNCAVFARQTHASLSAFLPANICTPAQKESGRSVFSIFRKLASFIYESWFGSAWVGKERKRKKRKSRSKSKSKKKRASEISGVAWFGRERSCLLRARYLSAEKKQDAPLEGGGAGAEKSAVTAEPR